MNNFNRYFWDSLFPSLKLEGSGIRDFLHGQTSGELKSLKDEVLLQTCWLNSFGQVRALLEIRIKENSADLLILAGSVEEVAIGLEKTIFPADKVRIVCIGELRRLQKLKMYEGGQFTDVLWIEKGDILPKSWDSLEKASFNEFTLWRLKQGILLGESEIIENNNPFELGLGSWVNLNKGCYLGQETLAKVANASGLKQELRFWTSEFLILSGENLFRDGSDHPNKRSAGVVVSSKADCEGKGTLGLAMIRRKYLSDLQLELSENRLIQVSKPVGFDGI